MKGSPVVVLTAKTILLISKEPNMREVLHLSLADLGGWQVFSTGSFLEGLQLATTDQPDAIVLAIPLSDRDYITFLRKLLAQPRKQIIPVVVLTAGAKWLDYKQLQHFHVVAAIDYAADPNELSNQIAKLLCWEANP